MVNMVSHDQWNNIRYSSARYYSKSLKINEIVAEIVQIVIKINSIGSNNSSPGIKSKISSK